MLSFLFILLFFAREREKTFHQIGFSFRVIQRFQLSRLNPVRILKDDSNQTCSFNTSCSFVSFAYCLENYQKNVFFSSLGRLKNPNLFFFCVLVFILSRLLCSIFYQLLKFERGRQKRKTFAYKLYSQKKTTGWRTFLALNKSSFNLWVWQRKCI